MDNYIKANLPATEQDYLQGCGEGVFIIVTPEIKEAYNNDEAGTIYSGTLDNDSIYYKGLTHGEQIPFEMRGELRPVVPLSWLQEHFEINKDFFKGTPLFDYL